MRKYTQPKIKAVELDSNQAVLQVCMTGGIFMMPTLVSTSKVKTIAVGLRPSSTFKGNT